LVARATTKFVESYAGALGKGAAAFAVGAAATLLYNIGVGKEIVEPIWGQADPSPSRPRHRPAGLVTGLPHSYCQYLAQDRINSSKSCLGSVQGSCVAPRQ
jgi:hypothetical protein